MIKTIKTIALYMLSIPFLAFMILFDVMKLPLIIIFFLPIWGLLDLMSILRGKDSMIVEILVTASIMGILLWMDIVGLEEPKWLKRI